MKCSLLALDFDGVIVDSVGIKADVMRRIGEPFGPELRDRLVMYHLREGGVSRYEKFRWLYHEAYGREITDPEMRSMTEKFEQYLGKAMQDCPFLPGFEELLETWHRRVPIYVCSGAPQPELDELLHARDVARYFRGIRGYPPAKTPLLASILREAGVDPAGAVMVGDTVTDSRAAEENGTLFFGIGAFFENDPRPHGRDLRDLNAWLAGQDKTKP